ncbi:MAG: hypothetical protein EAZ70_12095 [Runella slithyformis]|nr:MAG: hypothetical protein EAZ70_12095 [Runella slithyformis]TAF79176.1 MAG: hypothetical protein EAZ50_12060 [Runella slithyformis]
MIIVAIVGALVILLGSRNTYTYDVENVITRNNFKPQVSKPIGSHSYSMHVQGELDGTAELHLLGPKFDLNKEFNCTVDHFNSLDSGKVDKYFHRNYYDGFATLNLCYIPCTAKKGHLTIKISFGRDLRKSWW